MLGELRRVYEGQIAAKDETIAELRRRAEAAEYEAAALRAQAPALVVPRNAASADHRTPPYAAQSGVGRGCGRGWLVEGSISPARRSRSPGAMAEQRVGLRSDEMGQDGDEYTPVTMDELLVLLPAGGRVLDLGCGRGSFHYDAFPDLAIDALDESVVLEDGRFPSHVRYQQGVAERLPYPDRWFDLVITNFVLEHVQDFPRAIEEIARVVKPEGYFYMAVPNAGSFEDALYRALYAGGGHIQRHSFESVLATVYGRTALKLIAYNEWPAGFTFLEDREGLRALVEQFAVAYRESLRLDLRARSNYLFVFQQQRGLGRRVTAAVCGYCGGGVPAEIAHAAEWDCPRCGRRNGAGAHGAASDDRLDGDMRALWARYPYLRRAPILALARRLARQARSAWRARRTAPSGLTVPRLP